jgi:microcompartment protein CcmL/EutN
MKKASALAVFDFDNIPTAIQAVDALLKKAPIAFLKSGTVTRGRYLVVFGGSTAATGESVEATLDVGGSSVLDHSFLPDVHQALHDAMFGRRRNARESLLILETETASSIVRAVEAALKGTPVELIEVRLSDSGLSGKGIALLAGPLHDVEAAAALAASGLGDPPRGFSHRIIAAPHDDMARVISTSTSFETSPVLDLDGEEG